jgi:hypothetical protein
VAARDASAGLDAPGDDTDRDRIDRYDDVVLRIEA